jgi:CRP-like cAMP-binding protein
VKPFGFDALLDADERAAWHALLARRAVRVAKAREILRPGERAEQLIIVLTGWVQRYKQLRGKRQILSLYLPGDICDQSALVGQRSTTALAGVCDVDVALVDPGEALAAFDRFPGLDRLRRANVAAQIRIEREWTVSLGLRSAEEGIAHLCCELLARQGYDLEGAIDAPLPFNQAQLGEALGLTAVHVNRTLALLRRRYGLSARGQRLNVTDAAGLAELAQFDGDYLRLSVRGMLERPIRIGATPMTEEGAVRIRSGAFMERNSAAARSAA